MGLHILVLGAGGMLGRVTFTYLKEQGHTLTGITRSKTLPGIVNLDATDAGTLSAFLECSSFDVIINCAALLVGDSERRPADAVRVNAWLPHFLEERYRNSGTYLIQVSTDGVFSGADGGYKETDAADADTFYGRSKLLGELHNGKDLTVRSGFWGADANGSGTGLFHWFMQQEGSVAGYPYAFFNGVSNLEFAQFAQRAIQERWTGVYHLCAADTISKYEFLQLQNRVFSRGIALERKESVRVNRALACTRQDVTYSRKSFARQMQELKEWTAGREEFTHGERKR